MFFMMLYKLKMNCIHSFIHSLLKQWDLVCENKYLSSLSTTIYFTGVLVGGLVCGPIADIMGRRPLMIVTMYLPVLLGIMVYLVQNVVLFMLLRFCIGIMMQVTASPFSFSHSHYICTV